MKKLKTIMLFISITCLFSCQRACQSLDRSFQSSKMQYDIKMYSGGQCIYHDNLETIVNNSESSDGCYYYKGDTLIELTGDIVIKAQ